MKKGIVLFFIFAFIAAKLVAIERTDQKISTKLTVGTFNIRLQTDADSAERSWVNRKGSVARIIKQYGFDVFGVQEVGNTQQEADLKALIPEYTYFGKGRDNEQGTDGEQVGIFYKTNRFTEKDKGSFFLSETPEKMGMGWDAVCRRMCVWTKLYDKKTKKDFYFFCTHFDHMGKVARVESAKLIVKRIKLIAGDSPVLCVGDLNTSPEESAMYKILTSYLDDSRKTTLTPPQGSLGTYNGYNVTTDSFPIAERIDYILTRKIKVQSYRLLTDRYEAKTYPSDHFPVVIECKIK